MLGFNVFLIISDPNVWNRYLILLILPHCLVLKDHLILLILVYLVNY